MSNKKSKQSFKLSSEILIFVGAFAVLIGAFWWAGLVEWALFFAALGGLLASFEIYAVCKLGKTLSERFGETLRKNPKVGWILWGLLAVAFAALLWHLVAMR